MEQLHEGPMFHTGAKGKKKKKKKKKKNMVHVFIPVVFSRSVVEQSSGSCELPG
jgi:hypothetical protein